VETTIKAFVEIREKLANGTYSNVGRIVSMADSK
jgi:hypothetical protein